MEFSIESVLVNNNKFKDLDESNPLSYLDIQKSTIEPLLSEEDILSSHQSDNTGEKFYHYYCGAILKFNFKLIFKNSLPDGSSIIIFTSHHSRKSFKAGKKKKYVGYKKSKDLFLSIMKFEWLRERTVSSTIDCKVDLEKFNLNRNPGNPNSLKISRDAFQKDSVVEQTEKADINNSYIYFSACNSMPVYENSMNFDSKSFNIADYRAEAIWISIKHRDVYCKPLSLSLPPPCLENMVYLVAEPAYLNISFIDVPEKMKISRVIEFMRSDCKPVKMSWEQKSKKFSFIKIKNLRDNEVQISMDLNFVNASPDVIPGKDMIYLDFTEEFSKRRLGISIPVRIQKK